MDYILVRGEIPQSDIEYLDEFELGKLVGDWSLYKRKLVREDSSSS